MAKTNFSRPAVSLPLVLITGASAGIGAACARAFAGAGYGVVLTARRKERIDALADELRSAHGVEIHAFALDVSRREEVEAWFESQRGLAGRIGVLVNNAGLARGLVSIQQGSLDDWDEMIDTNVKGLLYMTRLMLPHLLAAGRGHIVNLGSVAGRWNYPRGNIYAATKWAVRSLSESLRLDLNGTPIRVTEIAPGMVETEFSEVRLGDAGRAKAVYAGMQPLTPEDIAEAVLWSVSRPAHVNIQEIVLYPVDQASPSVVMRR